MKKIYSILVLFLTISSIVVGQCNQSIYLSSQEAIDNFAVDYGCTVIQGSLIIKYNSNLGSIISNLSGLNGLTAIEGNLEIFGNSLLENIDELSSLTSIYGDLIVAHNASLLNLDAFSDLNVIEGNLLIYNNNALENVDGLSAIDFVEGDCIIEYNNALSNVDGLSSVFFVGGNLEIHNNAALSNVDGLSVLGQVVGDLLIEENDMLSNVNGLSSLDIVNGDLSIVYNDLLSNVDGFNTLDNIEGNLTLYENSSLENVDGFSTLDGIGDMLYIYNNDMLSNIDGFSTLDAIGGTLKIEENDILQNINGLGNVTTIGGNFEIGTNASLDNIDGLSSLTFIGGNLHVILENIEGLNTVTSIGGNLHLDNTVLSDVDDFSLLTSIGGHLVITDNTLLENIDGFGSLTSIGGNLEIENNVLLEDIGGFSSLTSIGGTFSVNIDNIDGLNAVISIGGNLVIDGSVLTNVDAFSSLTFIGYNLEIKNNNLLENTDGFSALTSIGRDLYIENNPLLLENTEFSSLSSIGRNFAVELGSVDGFSALTSIDGNLSISNNNILTNVDGFSSLTSIGDDVYIFNNDTLSNLDGLNSLDSIGGYLSIRDNALLENIDGLSSLTSIGYYCSIENNKLLENVDGLSSLNSIEGSLLINDNVALVNIDGLSSLTSVGTNLTIFNNDLLEDLDGFNVLSSIGFNLSIKYNDGLSDINGLSSLAFIGYNLEIENNIFLSSCCIIPHLSLISTGEVIVENNATNCTSLEEVIAVCGFSTINIQAFYDENENGILDGNEEELHDLPFTISPTVETTANNADGTTTFYVNMGTYTVQYDNANNSLWQVENAPDNYTITITESTDTTFYFPIQPATNFFVQNTDLTSSITRCNQQTNLWLTYTNNSSEPTSGYVSLLADEIIEFEYAIPSVDSIAGDTLYWFYEDLYPTHSKQIKIVYTMPGVDFIGVNIDFDAQMETWEGHGNDKDLYDSELICAYDPNDKQSSPTGYGTQNYTLLDDTLDYFIRFQNTGNDTAFNIIIRDTISNYLDLSSFRFISSSHDANIEINQDTRIIEFQFEDIYLPDSNVNEIASHGFIKFEIEAINGLEQNTVIENTAGIYFDFNPPIVTNTTHNTMVDPLPLLESEVSLKVYLEGAYDPTTGEMKTDLSDLSLLPTSQPFNTAPYNYNGNEGMGYPITAVDWVLVEARIGTPNISTAQTTLVESVAGFLLADGTIVDTFGDPLIFRDLEFGESYHFVIRHRNHLDIISTIDLKADAQMSIDFTASPQQAFGTNQQKILPNGKPAMYAGDYNQDGIIQITDYDEWKTNPAQNNIYENTDGTLDGIIQTTDFDAWRPNKAKLGNIEIQF